MRENLSTNKTMNQPRMLDGKSVAAAVLDECRAEVEALKSRGTTPGLAVVLVGDRTFGVGDWIQCSGGAAGTLSGVVEGVGFRSTRIPKEPERPARWRAGCT